MLKHLKIRKELFWDIDPAKLDEEKNKRLIIERVFTRGDIDDIRAVFKLYGLHVIKQEIVKAGFLDKKTLKWASDLLGIPLTKFKCYTKRQSNPAHWNY
jgi:hypothetical protein